MEKQNNNMYTIKCMYKEPSSICILNTSRFTYIDCATFEITTKIFNVQRFKSEKDYDLVHELLKFDHPLKEITKYQYNERDRYTPLFSAAQHGSLECSKIFIEMGVDVNFQNMNGETALMLSSQNGHTEVVELLLSHNVGANVNAIDKNDRTALFHAVTSGSIECVKILLSSNKININHQDQFEINILMLALSIRKACADIINTYAECFKLLQSSVYGPDDTNINSFLDTDEETVLVWADKNNQMECIEVLLSHGVDINAKDEYELTALMHAVCHGTVNSAELLFKYNPDINIVNKFGQTALIMASWKGKIECVQLLLKYDANNINLTDSINEDSALICASKEGHIECVKELLLYNANINASNKYGGTALIYASKEGH
eukprot:398159_1